MSIKIATAECFTHGKVAEEIHAFSRGYPGNYTWKISPGKYGLSLVAGLFIPTLSGVRTILRIDPLPVISSIDDIKVYDQDGDLAMALMMAEAVKNITGAEIGIGTTAGIGEGGIAVVSNVWKIVRKTGEYADLRTDSPLIILKRQKSGINITLFCLEKYFLDHFQRY
jgi:uncharacterized protein (UPF0254 family)